MAHFAELDQHNKVTRVVVVSNAAIQRNDGVEIESMGIELLRKLYGSHTKWVQCSYNGTFREIYPAKGDRYDPERNIFVRAPVYRGYVWDEETKTLNEIPRPEVVVSEHDLVWHQETGKWGLEGVPLTNNGWLKHRYYDTWQDILDYLTERKQLHTVWPQVIKQEKLEMQNRKIIAPYEDGHVCLQLRT